MTASRHPRTTFGNRHGWYLKFNQLSLRKSGQLLRWFGERYSSKASSIIDVTVTERAFDNSLN